MQYIKLSEVTKFVRNGASIKQNKTNHEGYPITRIETISNDMFNYDRLGYASITDDKYQSFYLQNYDVLLSHINSEKYLGRSVLYIDIGRGPIIHGMNLLNIRFDLNKYDPRYFVLYTKTGVAKLYFIENTKHAVNQASISSTAIKNMPIPKVTLQIQHQIADDLESIQHSIEEKLKSLFYYDELIKSRFNVVEVVAWKNLKNC